jgi:cell division protein ZapA (FtsZ GTPase activity inhibitor)
LARLPATAESDGESMEQIDVQILDRDYKLAVGPDESQFLEADRRRKMRSIRAGRIGGLERIAVMAALQLANGCSALKTNGIALSTEMPAHPQDDEAGRDQTAGTPVLTA